MSKKIFALVMVLCMVAAMMSTAVAAPRYTDTEGHWAESSIDRWTKYGVVGGNDGKFDPDAELTRGQLAKILVELLNLPAAPSAGFSDVNEDEWYADAINACYAAGIMLGADGMARPNDPVSREETMVMLGRALGIEPVESNNHLAWEDGHEVSDWAAGYMNAMINAGIVGGTGNGLQPGENINRASTMTMLDRAISGYANEDGQTITASGDGIVIVAADNVTVTGNAEKVVVTAPDTTVVLTDANVGEVSVQAENTTVVITGETKAETVTVTESAVNTSVVVDKDATVENVTTEAPKTEIQVEGTVSNVQVSENATNANVSGEGTVDKVVTSGDNTSVETSGTTVNTATGTTGTTVGGNTVTGGSTTVTQPEHVCTVVASVVTAPTCTEDGYTTYTTCCGASYTGDVVEATGHDYSEWTSNNEGTHSKVCVNCSITVTEDCSYVDETAAVSECEYCGYVGSPIFAGGTGTQKDPFIISNRAQLESISDNTEYAYYKVADGVRTIDGSNWPTDLIMIGNFDGNGVVINNLDYALFRSVGAYADEENTYTIKNITINANINSTTSGIAAVVRNAASKMVFENVNVHGYIEGTAGAASYIGFGPANRSDKTWDTVPFDVTFKNCVSDATIVATGDQAVGFVKHPYSSAADSVLRFVDSAYTGSMYSVSNPKYFIGNGNSYLAEISYSEEFVNDLGYNPVGTLYAEPSVNSDGLCNIGNYPANSGAADKYIKVGSSTVIEKKDGSISGMEKGDAFTITKAENAVSATLTLEITPNDTNEVGSYLGTYMTEIIDLTEVGETFTTEEIKYFDITINDTEAAEGLTENTYNVVNSFYGKTHNGAYVRVVQHDANGVAISIITYKIAEATTP